MAAIKESRVTKDFIDAGYDESQMVWCDNFEECINAVKNGKADITFVNRYVSEYFLNMYRYSGIYSTLTTYSHQICLAVYGDDTKILSSILSKTMLAISKDELDNIMIESTSNPPNQNIVLELVYRNPLITVLICGGFIAIVAISIISLFFTRKMHRKNKALENANNSRQQFLSRISHDMRTPMNAIIGFVGFAEKSQSLDETRQYCNKISSAGNYLLQLINDSLDLNKLGNANYALHLEPYSNKEFISEVRCIVEGRAKEKNISLTIEGDTNEEYSIMFDKLRLQQIFVNLLNNAIKFTNDGGSVSMQISSTEKLEGKELIHFVVRDNGIGMSQEFIENKLFKPFEEEHAENSTSGTGLGLSIVKNLVDIMGGNIRCESMLNEGTTFYVDLYGKKVETPKKKVVETVKKDIDLKNINILLCEDNVLNREIANRLLSDKGIIVTNAVNGKDGVDKFSESEIGFYDLILMDIRMPIMDGLEATKKIRSLNREDAALIPIIAISANAFDDDIAACKAAGMNAHLGKPIVLEKMFETIEKNVRDFKSKY